MASWEALPSRFHFLYGLNLRVSILYDWLPISLCVGILRKGNQQITPEFELASPSLILKSIHDCKYT